MIVDLINDQIVHHHHHQRVQRVKIIIIKIIFTFYKSNSKLNFFVIGLHFEF